MDRAIPFVDAHIHLWELSRIGYPWLSPPFDDNGPNGSAEAIAQDYLVEDYKADAARWNMVGAVHIDAGARADQALEETSWLESLAESQGLPTAIVGFAALNDPTVEGLLEEHACHPHVRGIRHIVNWHTNPMRTYSPSDVTQDDQWWAGYGLLGKYGLSFDLQCYAGQMAGLAPLIERHPEIPVIINHLGMPVTSDREGVARWRYGMRSLAAIRHVSVKLSGLGFIYRDWSYETVEPFLSEAVELFGPQRCLFASDTPTDKLFAPFDVYLESYHRFSTQFSLDERHDMFGRNANRVYRLGLAL
jgi:predicted TIM-barrel fold metal-dependent hydrolase